MPNFLVIGAARSGTTTLHRCLGQHPEIFMSPFKEPSFFASDDRHRKPEPGDSPVWPIGGTFVTDRRRYESLFDGVRSEQAIGEISPLYLFSPSAPDSIQRHIPRTRLIAILRDPVERAYAAFLGTRREGIERREDFGELVRAALRPGTPAAEIDPYLSGSLYAKPLRRYFDRFDAEQLRIFIFEDFRRDPEPVFRELFEFLEVDPDFVPDSSMKHNASGVIRNPLLRAVWTGSLRYRVMIRHRIPNWERIPPLRMARDAAFRMVIRNLERPTLDPEIRAELLDRLYRPEILELQEMLGRDLGHWLSAR